MICFFFHKWRKWDNYIETGHVTLHGFFVPKEERGQRMPYTQKRQRRECLRCGKHQDELIDD